MGGGGGLWQVWQEMNAQLEMNGAGSFFGWAAVHGTWVWCVHPIRPSYVPSFILHDA